MTEQLTVNGIQLDIIPNQISRKIRVAKLGSPTEKLSSYSAQFKMPRTVVNTTAFEQLGVTGNQSKSPYRTLRANYTVNTIPLVNLGYLTVEGTDEKYFNVRLTDGIIDLAEKLKGKKMNQLDLADIKHFLSAQTVADSLTNTEGYIYAYADFGVGTNKVERLVPSVFKHTLWTKIFNGAGINYEGDFFTKNQDYLNEVMTPVTAFVPVNSGAVPTALGSIATNSIDRYETERTSISLQDTHSFNNDNLIDFTIASNGVRSGMSGRILMKINTRWSNRESYVYLSVRVNGSTRATISLSEGNNKTKTTQINMNIEPNDVISMTVQGSSKSDYSEFEDDDNGNFTSYQVDYNVSNTIEIDGLSGGQLIDYKQIIGDMSQIDFLKDIMSRYGLFMTPVKDNPNVYSFKQIDGVLGDRANAADWTNKLVSKGGESYNNGLAKSNMFKFKYTKDIQVFPNDGTLNINNENTENEKTFYQSPFEIPLQAGTFNGEPLYSIPILEEKDGIVEAKETPNKLMSVKRVQGTLNLQYFEQEAVNYTGLIPILSLGKIEMDYFINNHYRQYKNLMQNYVERDCEIDLSVIDIHNLRLDRLYYFGQLQRYCLLEEVQYKAGQNAKCRVLELRDFVENQPPSKLTDYSFSMNFQGTKTVTLDNLLTGFEDPEFDEPKQFRIINGLGNPIKIYQKGIEITTVMDINVEDLNLTITDTDEGTFSKSQLFEYRMSDTGSGQFSNDVGTITANVKALQNNPPIADAGDDRTVSLYGQDQSQSRSAYLNGSGSRDNTGEIVNWRWEIISKPTNSNATISQDTNFPNASLILPNQFSSQGEYTLQLTVQDEYGLTDTDTMEVDVTYSNSPDFGDGFEEN